MFIAATQVDYTELPRGARTRACRLRHRGNSNYERSESLVTGVPLSVRVADCTPSRPRADPEILYTLSLLQEETGEESKWISCTTCRWGYWGVILLYVILASFFTVRTAG